MVSGRPARLRSWPQGDSHRRRWRLARDLYCFAVLLALAWPPAAQTPGVTPVQVTLVLGMAWCLADGVRALRAARATAMVLMRDHVLVSYRGDSVAIPFSTMREVAWAPRRSVWSRLQRVWRRPTLPWLLYGTSPPPLVEPVGALPGWFCRLHIELARAPVDQRSRPLDGDVAALPPRLEGSRLILDTSDAGEVFRAIKVAFDQWAAVQQIDARHHFPPCFSPYAERGYVSAQQPEGASLGVLTYDHLIDWIKQGKLTPQHRLAGGADGMSAPWITLARAARRDRWLRRALYPRRAVAGWVVGQVARAALLAGGYAALLAGSQAVLVGSPSLGSAAPTGDLNVLVLALLAAAPEALWRSAFVVGLAALLPAAGQWLVAKIRPDTWWRH